MLSYTIFAPGQIIHGFSKQRNPWYLKANFSLPTESESGIALNRDLLTERTRRERVCDK